MPIFAKDWYEPQPDYTSFYQGDVVRDVPVIFLPDKISKWLLLRPDPQGNKLIDDVLKGEIPKWFEVRPEGQVPDAWTREQREEFVAAKARRMNVMIVTQSCDLEQRNYYQISPIYPETDQKATALDHLKENNLNYTFYLPAVAPHIPVNSYADLSHTTLIPKAYFPKNTVEARLGARLTELARTALQAQIADYFGRPFGFSLRDRAKVTSDYLCVSCFYIRGEAVKREFQADNNFERCTRCGEARWLRFVPPEQDGQPGTEPVIRKPGGGLFDS